MNEGIAVSPAQLRKPLPKHSIGLYWSLVLGAMILTLVLSLTSHGGPVTFIGSTESHAVQGDLRVDAPSLGNGKSTNV